MGTGSFKPTTLKQADDRSGWVIYPQGLVVTKEQFQCLRSISTLPEFRLDIQLEEGRDVIVLLINIRSYTLIDSLRPAIRLDLRCHIAHCRRSCTQDEVSRLFTTAGLSYERVGTLSVRAFCFEAVTHME